MSLQHDYGKLSYLCDECESAQTDPHKKMSDLVDEAKAEGWLITKEEDTDDFTHLCPDCVRLLPRV